MQKGLIITLSALLLIDAFEVQTFAKGEAIKEKVFYNQRFNNVEIAGELYKPENFDVNKNIPQLLSFIQQAA